MRTLADIKRRAAVVGTRLEVVAQTNRPVLVGTIRTIIEDPVCSRRGTRPPEQRSCWDWTGNTADTEGAHCTRWPKAAQVRIIDADTFEYNLTRPYRAHTIRLRFLSSEPTR